MALDRRVRELVFARDRYRCRRCGSAQALDPAHIFGRGTHATRWDPANILALCRTCHEWGHSSKGKRAFLEWAEAQIGASEMARLRAERKKPGHPDLEAIARELERMEQSLREERSCNSGSAPVRFVAGT